MNALQKRLLVLCLAAGAALALTELGLRSAEPRPGFRIWTPGLRATLAPDPARMPGIHGPSRFQVDAWGFRSDGPSAPAERAWLALGGSTTECLYLDQDETWPALLQRALAASLAAPPWIANAGKSGRNTRDHALQLRHLLPQEPRFERVLLLTGVNDLGSWLATGGTPASHPAEDLSYAFDVLPRGQTRAPWWKETALWSLARALRGTPGLSEDRAGAVYDTWRAHRRAAPRRLEELPEAGPALADFRAALAEVAAISARHGVELVLLTQPALWRADLPAEQEALLWMGGVGPFQRRAGCDYYSAAALARGLALFDATLREFAAAQGLAVLDLARELDGDPRCFYDDVHFNEEGARRVAEFLARELTALEPR